MSHASRQNILIIEEDRDSAESLSLLLELLGCEAQWARDRIEANLVFSARRRQNLPYPNLVLLDLHLPHSQGVTFGRELMQDPQMCPIVLFSALPEEALQQAADDIGACGVLRKPFGAEDLRGAIEAAVRGLRVTA
jgi:two-component system chemotaxis response regulator CheY